ncbi:MAG: hypothetical protein IT233_00215 [Bacteroidia bacterium]|nr:hypothetical protein [Bacteroidia bacterium]
MNCRVQFTVLSLLSALLLSASSADTIRFDVRPRLIGGIGTRNTFIYGFSAPVLHARVGAEWNKTFRMGAGFCWLKKPEFKAGRDQTPFIYLKPVLNEYNLPDTVPSVLRMVYFSYFAEYVYYSRKNWELSIPVQLGFGQMFYEYSAGGNEFRELEQPVFLYEPSVSVHYRVLRYFAIGADVGYRFALVGRKVSSMAYNSPIYDLKFMVLWGEVYRALFLRRILTKP